MRPRRRIRLPPLVLNVLANWAGYLVNVLLAFFLSPLVVHHLGASGYGVWALLLTLTGYLGLLDVGVRSAVTRYVARSHTSGERAAAVRIVSTALVLLGTMAAVAVVASIGVGLIAPHVFNIPAEHQRTTVAVAVLVGASTGIALVSGVFGGIVVGLQRFDVIAMLDIGTALVRATLLVIAIGVGGGLVDLACVQFVAAAIGALATGAVTLRLYPELRQRPAWSRRHLHTLFSYGGYAFAAHLATAIIDRAAVIVLGAFMPMAAVTVFDIASSLTGYVRGLAGGIRTTLAPLASALEARREREALHELVLRGARYCSMLVLPIAALLSVRGSSFIGLWMGAQYAGPVGEVLAVLALRLAFASPSGAVANVMLGAGRQRAVALAVIAEAVVTVAAVVLGVRVFGVSGAAWGLTIPAIVSSVLVWPLFAKRSLGVPLGDYIGAAWARPAIGVAPYVGATWLVERLWPAASLLAFAVQTTILLLLALVTFWRLSLPDEERQRWRYALRMATPGP